MPVDFIKNPRFFISLSMLSLTPGYCTLIATISLFLSTHLCTWPIDAAAMG